MVAYLEKTDGNAEYINANVTGKLVTISEASIRSDLLFTDADGIDSLNNQAIFDAIQLMGVLVGIMEVSHPVIDPYQEMSDGPATGLSKIKKLKKKSKPVITYHKAWMKSVSMKQRLAGKKSLKTKWMQKESVSKGRKPAKAEPTVHKDLAFDDLDDIVDDAMDYMESGDAQDEGRTSSVVLACFSQISIQSQGYREPADPIVAPEVGAVLVVSPTGVLDLVDYSSSFDSDPSKDSLPPAPDLPLVLPFLCSDDSEANGESEPADEDFRRWRSAPLSTPYPPNTLELSLGSSSERSLDLSSHSSRPSRKRCRSPTASVPSPTHVLRSIAPTLGDLLPPRKRFRDSYSSEDSGEEHMEVDTADTEAIADIGISEGVVAHPEDGVGMRFKIAASDDMEDDEEFEAEASAADTREIATDPLAIGDSSESSKGDILDLKDTIFDIVHYMSKLVASGERASLVERIRSLRLEYLKVRAMLSIERNRIDGLRWHMALSQEEFCQVHRDRDDTRRRLRRLELYVERHLGFRP
ncbi:hypothetical protein Tco_1530678 [Tanacetum coccineum]